MNVNFYVCVSVLAEYATWWAPAPEVIVIDKKKTSSNAVSAPAKSQVVTHLFLVSAFIASANIIEPDQPHPNAASDLDL